MKTAATWSRPAEIFRSKYRLLSTSIACFKQNLLKARPSTRGSKFQNADSPCAGSNRVSSNTFLQGVLTTRSAFMVRSASGYRGELRFFSGSAAVVFPGGRRQGPQAFGIRRPQGVRRAGQQGSTSVEGSRSKKDLPPGGGPCRHLSNFGPAGSLSGVRDRVWGRLRTAPGPNSKIDVFLKETIGF